MSYSYVLVLNSIEKRYPLPNDSAGHNDLAVISVSFREIEDFSFLNMIPLQETKNLLRHLSAASTKKS